MNQKNKEINKEISSNAIHGQPHDVFDVINKYGTYEIQPTADSENEFPKISQGLEKKSSNPNSHQQKQE